MAAALVALAPDPAAPPQEAGYEALVLSALAAGLPLPTEADSLELRLDDDNAELELSCPLDDFDALLASLASALAAPLIPQADFDRALRRARVAERRDSGDPLLRSAAELRAALCADGALGLPP